MGWPAVLPSHFCSSSLPRAPTTQGSLVPGEGVQPWEDPRWGSGVWDGLALCCVPGFEPECFLSCKLMTPDRTGFKASSAAKIL